MSSTDTKHGLRRTPLHALHVKLGAKMVPFAGYDMPVQYPAGVLKEHLHTRASAGLFDVSHMGQLSVVGVEAAAALERLIPIDIVGLALGRQRYGFLLDDHGGILDDIMVANLGDRFVLVVNAANKAADAAYLRDRLLPDIVIELLPHALIALQGPEAEQSLAVLAPDVRDMAFMDVRSMTIRGTACVVSRSGYTGEDGFELSVPADRVVEIAKILLSHDAVRPVGLGARDSLRLEAGLCLHGADIGPDTSPIEAALAWAIPPVRRTGGAREGGFPGSGRILDEMRTPPSRRRVGLKPEGRAPVRSGAQLFDSTDSTDPIGLVTSGGFGPSIQGPVAMGYVPTALFEPGRRLFADVRGQRLAVTVSRLPFVPARFKRTGAPPQARSVSC